MTPAEQAERAVLAAMLMDPVAGPTVCAILDATMFSLETYRILFRAMTAMVARGSPIDQLTLPAALDGDLERVGGMTFIAALTEDAPPAANVASHAAMVREAHYHREIGRQLQALADPALTPEQLSRGLDQLAFLRSAMAAKANGQRFALLTIEQMLKRPDPQWLIEDWLQAGTVGALFGEKNVGKSFVALDWALSMAAGISWCGHAVRQAPAIYVIGEGQGSFHRRIHSWLTAHRIAEPMQLPVVFLLESVLLLQGDHVAAFLNAVTALPSPPGLIVFDTLARMSGGGDENSTQDMSALVASVERIRVATGAVPLFIHHPPHGAARMRGSTVLGAAFDAEYRLSRDADGGLTLSNPKQRDAAEAPSHFLKLTPVDGSLVVDADTSPTRQRSLADRVCDVLKQKPGCSFGMLWQTLGGDDAPLRRELKDLESKGLIQVARGGPGNTNSYTLTGAPPGTMEATDETF